MPKTKNKSGSKRTPWYARRRVSCPHCGYTKYNANTDDPRQPKLVFIHHYEKVEIPNTLSLTQEIDVFECPRCHEEFRPEDSYEKYRLDAALEDEAEPDHHQ